MIFNSYGEEDGWLLVVCIDYRKLIEATHHDAYPLS